MGEEQGGAAARGGRGGGVWGGARRGRTVREAERERAEGSGMRDLVRKGWGCGQRVVPSLSPFFISLFSLFFFFPFL